MTMDYYAGIDVSLEQSSICVVDASGKLLREAKVSSEPEALIAWFCGLPFGLSRIGLEAGPLSQWLYAAMKEAGLAVELLETRHVRDAFKAMPVKTARKLVQSKLYDVEMSLRGILRGFGLKVGPTNVKSFTGRIKELAVGHPTLQAIAEALLSVHTVLARELAGFEKKVRSIARCDARVRLLMSAPGVGAIVAMTYVFAIDDPARFKSSRMVGAHFGLTPKKYQSGETDVTGRISKIGDSSVRAALYEAAHVILTRAVKGSDLKSWAMRLAKRAGMRKAKVALARKLAVVLHKMWVEGTKFIAEKACRPVATAA
jgi:transposase